jgi:hypothetical protein
MCSNSVQCIFSGLLWSPDEKRSFQRRSGGHVGITICIKSPTEVAVAMAAGKCQEVAALCHAVLLMTTFARLLGVSERFVLEVK